MNYSFIEIINKQLKLETIAREKLLVYLWVAIILTVFVIYLIIKVNIPNDSVKFKKKLNRNNKKNRKKNKFVKEGNTKEEITFFDKFDEKIKSDKNISDEKENTVTKNIQKINKNINIKEEIDEYEKFNEFNNKILKKEEKTKSNKNLINESETTKQNIRTYGFTGINYTLGEIEENIPTYDPLYIEEQIKLEEEKIKKELELKKAISKLESILNKKSVKKEEFNG